MYLRIPGEKKLSLQLDSRLLATPEAALQQAYNEVMHMGDMALEMLTIARENVTNPDEDALSRIAVLEDAIDQYEEGITHYLG